MIKQFAFDKSHRLLRNGQFQYTYKRGRSYPCPMMILIVAKSRGRTRVGFSVGKKVGNSVRRSRAKRLLRESYRLLANGLHGGMSLVFVARAVLVDAPFAQVHSTMAQLLYKAGCYQEDAYENNAHRDISRI